MRLATIRAKYTGESLKNLRQGLLMTQSQLAEKLGVSVTTLSYWEHNHKQPTLNHLAALKKFFEERPSDIWNHSDEGTAIGHGG